MIFKTFKNFMLLLLYQLSFEIIQHVYGRHLIYIWFTYDMYMINTWHVYGCWYQGLNLDIFGNNYLCNQRPFNIMIKRVKDYIYHDYIWLFYKSNSTYVFLNWYLFKWNKWEFILEVFSNVYTCMKNKHIKFQTIRKKKHIWIALMTNNSKDIFSSKKMFWQVATCVYTK